MREPDYFQMARAENNLLNTLMLPLLGSTEILPRFPALLKMEEELMNILREHV